MSIPTHVTNVLDNRAFQLALILVCMILLGWIVYTHEPPAAPTAPPVPSMGAMNCICTPMPATASPR